MRMQPAVPWRRLLRTSSFVTAFTLAAAQAFAQDVTIRPRLRTGDEFRLEIVRTRDDSSRPQQNGRSRTVVDVRVLSAASEGFVVEWAPGETVLDNPQTAQDPLVAAASQALSEIRFRLMLNADGKLAGVANEAEVAPKLQAMLDTVVRNLSARLPAEQRKAFQNVVGQVLSPAALISSATREAEIYFGLNGVVLAAGEAAETDLQLPNPLGGGVIPAKFRVDMKSATADSASLNTTTTYDSAALLRMTQSLARQAGAPVSTNELTKIPPMQMGDDGKYLFDTSVGLMRQVTVNRRLSAGNNRRHDGWEIRLLNGPKR
jgi:hypothetical protein